MIREDSFGIIPLKKQDGKWVTLLVRHGKGHWAFPKGHAEKGESPLETALRELKEEVGLECEELLSFDSLHEHYFFQSGSQKIEKHVTYFLAKVTGEILLQAEEIDAFEWLPLERAATVATFKETKRLCEKVSQLLK